MGGKVNYDDFRESMLYIDKERAELFASVERVWSLEGRTQDQSLVVELCWSQPSYRPRLIIRDADEYHRNVGANELSTAALATYNKIAHAVEGWRRGQGELPAGTVAGLDVDITTTNEESEL